MRVKAKMPIKHLGKSGYHYDLMKDDEVTIRPGDEGDAQMMIMNGWVVNVETGESNPALKNPHTIVHTEAGSVIKPPVGTEDDVPVIQPDDSKVDLGTT